MFGRRRTDYLLITKHSQTLSHHTDQIDSGDSGTYDRQSVAASSNASSTERISDNEVPACTASTALNPVVYTIYGFQYSSVRLYFFHALSILLIGIPYQLFKWFPYACLRFKYRKCDLDESDVIFVSNNRGQSSIERVIVVNVTKESAKYYEDILKEINHEYENCHKIRIFLFEHVRYIFNNRTKQFVRMRDLDEVSTTNQLIYANESGVGADQRKFFLELYGKNTIEIAVKSYWELFRSEILNPFYLFQIFSITLWCLDEYYYYAGCVFVLSAISIFASLHETRAQSITLYNVIENLKSDNISVVQPSYCEEDEVRLEYFSPDILVPGDIIALPADGGILACDCVLLSGSCIVNESMLTGESVPVTKTPPTPSDQIFQWASQKRHILYAGTTVLQTRYYGNEKVLAKVVRTSFNTSKGELVKSILFPRPIEFRFYEDSIRFVSVLFCVAAMGMAYTVRLFSDRDADSVTILLRALDIITIVVPPALPLAMTAGTVYSQSRLKEKNIFCISPQRINVCGKLKLICFDKTGTLTDDGLTMDGCIQARYNRQTNSSTFSSSNTNAPHTFDDRSALVQNMATCHSLTTINGVINGDPLDIEMFRSIDFEYAEPGEEHMRYDTLAPTVVRPKRKKSKTPNMSPTSDGELVDVPYSIGIIKQHQFSSEAQCMSVIVRVLGDNHFKVFSKGAPEKIASLCKPDTIPANFYQLLNKYTSRGYRVIALAHKKLSSKIKWMDAERMKRTEIETDLIFDGFLVLLNCLKPETTNIIEELHAAKLRTVMITGDNIMTALSVAKECKMIRPGEEIYIVKCEKSDEDGDIRPRLKIEMSKDIGAVPDDESSDETVNNITDSHSTLLNISNCDKFHFALDGHTWNAIQQYYPHFITRIVARGTIFARFRPEQKSQIVMCLQKFDYIVAMCGDGANDCGALKAAHIGISLSQAEASVAAPFTSKEQNITCVKHLALEGRCALVTSFGLFKYMTMYSLIQFITILIMYSHSSILGNFQFLYIDLIITASLAFTMGRQGPSKKLTTKRPSSSLISLANVIPLLLQVLLCACIQFGAIFYLYNQSWFESTLVADHLRLSPINTTLPNSHSTEVTFIERTLCWENTVLFVVSCYQYLVLGVVYSKGLPYRQPLHTNGLMVIIVVVLSGFTLLLLLRPPAFLSDLFEIKPYIDTQTKINAFRLSVIAFPLLHALLSFGIELLIVDRRWFKKCLHFVLRKKVPKNKFKQIELDLMKDEQSWFDVSNGQNCI